jgi:hypothetical protein
MCIHDGEVLHYLFMEMTSFHNKRLHLVKRIINWEYEGCKCPALWLAIWFKNLHL